MSAIPLGLKQALESGDCVLFLGAGIGGHMVAPDGRAAPMGWELAQELSCHFSLGVTSGDLAKIAELVELRKGRPPLEDYVRKRLANMEPDADLRWLFSLRWKAIFTTNYDRAIERAYELNSSPLQKPITIAVSPEFVSHDPRFEVPVYHLHGTLFGGHNKVVLTQRDYDHFKEHRRMLFEILKQEFATSNILYVGYANQDPNWSLVLSELSSEFYPSPLPQSYRVAPGTDPIDAELLRAKNVDTIDADLASFAGEAAAALSESRIDPDRLKRLAATVPTDLASAFEKNPAALLRLLSSWVYVNQAPFNDPPNTRLFLEGDRPNWALIAKKHHFSRDLEEDLYDEVLDYVTSNAKKPTSLSVLGPAGYGISTMLMSTAVRLVQEGVSPVLMHRSGTPLLEGDVLFAASLTANAPVLIVDDAADHARELQSALTQLRGDMKPAIFVFGERLNEWHQSKGRPNAEELLVEPLSDGEITRLLDCLSSHHALNKLESIPRDIQFSVIKEKHRKELLVAMKEATEGMGFDAILENEYRSLRSDLARHTYLAVSCFYMYGAYVRDALLAKLVGVDLPTLYEETKSALDGVVIYDEIDDSRGTYAARTRHRTIATIIWERSGEPAERDRLVLAAMQNLNLAYGADRNVFEKFVRSDRLIDHIRGLEGKIQFFDSACKKEPENPYVRQHYARMLARENRAELALTQIDEAIRLSGRSPIRVLFHTKGVILQQLALTIESEGLARKRLVQSEDAYRRSINLNPKDEYGYQGLAQLYVGWAKRALTETEGADYIAKAEDTINEGLKKVKLREGLWIVSSDIERWLGDTPSRIKALEKAVQDSPGSVVARYLLGTVYRRMGTPEKALSILEPTIKGHPDEFRSFIEYALALLDLGRPVQEAIAILRISETLGLSDPRFIATLGGLLFTAGSYDDAAKVFQESTRRELSVTEMHTAYFRPTNPDGSPLQLQGKVLTVRPRFSLIDAEGYPRFLCPSSKSDGLQLKVDMKVRFVVEFTAKGPVADHPRLV